MGMTVEDFMDLCIDSSIQTVTLYDTKLECDVFTGTVDEMNDNELEAIVESFDCICKGCDTLTLNVTTF